jgi:hypothetical protein
VGCGDPVGFICDSRLTLAVKAVEIGVAFADAVVEYFCLQNS